MDVLAIAHLSDGADRGGLEVGQRVATVGGGELPQQVLAGLGHQVADGVADPVLDRLRGPVGEVALQRPRQVPAVRAEHLVELALELLGERSRPLSEGVVDLPRRLLELGPDQLGVGAGLLALEHPGADLDGVLDRLDRVLARLLAGAHQPHRGRVVDQQAVDRDAVSDRAHDGGAKWGGGLHGTNVAA